MSPDMHILLSGALTFGVPLALAIRELVVLGRDSPGTPGKDGDVMRDHHPTPPPRDEPSLPPLPPGLVQALRGDPDAAGRERAAPRILERA